MNSESWDLSRDQANELLRYGIKVLKEWWIKPNSPKNSVSVKKRLVEIFVSRLARAGYWWQAERLRNHLHRYLAGAAASGAAGSDLAVHLQPKADTLSERERREVSSLEVAPL